MARGDGTGPMGFGPMTGRGAGFCAGFLVPGFANRGGYGRGFGYGRGGGRGRGRGFGGGYYAAMAPRWAGFGYPAGDGEFEADIDEKEFLEQQVEALEDQIQQIKRRLSEMKEGDAEK